VQDTQADPSPAGTSPPLDPVRVQILATEHWSLLATRGLIWNEIFSRANMFLTTLSAAVVALALVAQATDFGDDFSLFALLVLPVVLLLGIWTSIRLGIARDEDVWMVVGMNRLRNAYMDITPDLERYFITSCHDDLAGVLKTYSPTAPPRLVRILASTPVLVGVINSALVGVIVALIVEFPGNPPLIHVGAGAIAAVAAGTLFVGILPFREQSRLERGLECKFPHPNATGRQVRPDGA
jgi:hypothetical protein